MWHLFSFLSRLLSCSRCFQVLFFSAAILGCLIAFIPNNGGLQPNVGDKLVHGSSFFILTFLFHLAYPRLRVVYAILVLGLLGIFIELVQLQLPYRSFEWLDIVADLVGILVYCVCVNPFMKKLLAYNKSVPD